MDKCFKGTESFIAVYIDDILVFSKNEKDHAKHVEIMLKICEDNGLVLSPTKMKIAVSTVDFLGAVIGEGTIKLQPHIIKKIVNFNEEELKTKKGLRSFLGILDPGNIQRKISYHLETDGWYEGYGEGIVKMERERRIQEDSERFCAYAVMTRERRIFSSSSSLLSGGTQRPYQTQSELDKLRHRDQSPKGPLKRSAAQEAVKSLCDNAKQFIQCKGQICWWTISKKHGQTKEKDDAIKADGKYHYNRKGFLEDDKSSDDSILIVDPGWDDYCLQELKLNRPVPCCPDARRAHM
ncbi:ORFIII-like polyprotein [Tanacetum coccineum]